MPPTAVGTGRGARSAPYGQACLACFKTKCKCVPRVGGTGCERCHRLKRPCHSADALRRRGDKNQNANSSDARIEKLEGTLSHLVSLLQSGSHVQASDMTNTLQRQQSPQQQQQHKLLLQEQQLQPSPDAEIIHQQHSSTLSPTSLASLSQQDRSAEEDDGPINIDASSGEQDEDGGIGVDNDAAGAFQWAMAVDSLGGDLQTATAVRHASPEPSSAVSEVSFSPTLTSACLDTLRSHKLPHFPFVQMPANVTTRQLQRERPFLLRAIVCVTSPAHDKRTRALELKRVLCEALFLQDSLHQPQQALDLLLGLVTYVAWGWDHVLSRGSLSRLMAVAVSLAGEILLLLDKAVPEPTRTIRLLEPKGFGGWSRGTTTGVEASNGHFYLECQRAVLGCFVLASAVSAYFSEIDAPRWTAPMEEGLAAITSSGSGVECPSDAALAFQVRLQLIAIRATKVREQCQFPGQSPVATLSAPSLLYIKTLMGQVQDLRVSLPPALQHHFGLLAQTYYTELCIIETIHSREEPASISNPTPSPPTCGPTRISCFWQSALASKSCTSTLLTFSPSDLRGVSFIQWTQLARCIATLHHLGSLSEPGWDLGAVRSLVDLPVLLDSVAEKLEQASIEVGDEAPGGVFNQLACGLRRFRVTYQDQDHGKGTGPLPTQEEGAQAVTGADAHAVANAQPRGYFLNPTLWLDQLFVDCDEQEIVTL